MSDPIHLKLAKAINRLAQTIRPDTKIFFIGFNRTGTVSLHALMLLSGIKSVHYTEDGTTRSPKVAQEIERRLDDRRALKAYLSQWTAFSDLTGNLPGRALVDGNRHFRLFDELFPGSFFVLNDRDTDAWIRSRIRFEDGLIIREHMRRRGVSAEEVSTVWRRDKEDHVRAVLQHFRGSKRFLHFHIDRDPPSTLTSFLWPTFLVSPRHWRHFNRTTN